MQGQAWALTRMLVSNTGAFGIVMGCRNGAKTRSPKVSVLASALSMTLGNYKLLALQSEMGTSALSAART